MVGRFSVLRTSIATCQPARIERVLTTLRPRIHGEHCRQLPSQSGSRSLVLRLSPIVGACSHKHSNEKYGLLREREGSSLVAEMPPESQVVSRDLLLPHAQHSGRKSH